MKYCCETCKHELETCPSVSAYMGDCDGWEQKPITNADQIRAMADEELAEFLSVGCRREGEDFICSDYECEKCWLRWLKEDVKR